MRRAQKKAAELRRRLGLRGRVDAEAVASILGLEVVAWPMRVQEEMQMGRYIGVAERSGRPLAALGDSPRHWAPTPSQRQPPVDSRPHESEQSVRAGGRGVRARVADGRGRSYGGGPEREAWEVAEHFGVPEEMVLFQAPMNMVPKTAHRPHRDTVVD